MTRPNSLSCRDSGRKTGARFSWNRSGLVAPLLAVSACALLLSACNSFNQAVGNVRTSPNEFTVVTKAPLIMPPDFTLRPPTPGAPPANQTPATQAAENALFERTGPGVVAATTSPAETALLEQARATSADASIRQKLRADAAARQRAQNNAGSGIWPFGASAPASDPTATDVAAAPARVTAPSANAPANPSATPSTSAPSPAPAAPGTLSGGPAPRRAAPAAAAPAAKSDSGGWFDWF